MRWKKGTWTKDGKTIKGQWRYSTTYNTFYVVLDELNPITGRKDSMEISGSRGAPEFNGWKLVEDENEQA